MSQDPLQFGLVQIQAEFEGNRLEVALVPARRETNVGAQIRVAISKNAAWYRKLCADYPSSRRRRNLAPDTRIRRSNIARILQRLVDGQPTRSKYTDDLRRFAAAAIAPATPKRRVA